MHVMVKNYVLALFYMSIIKSLKNRILVSTVMSTFHTKKLPRYVRFFNEFPMTASGKAQKFKLQEFMCNELGLERNRIKVKTDFPFAGLQAKGKS